ncbi:hypothetical protein [Nocardia mexicana]|uniref:Uncharacterized protein n=1 Tax=Nocardia mexicana TaxID=279262 RepID=A0A370GIJ3_9NOCA|nr:hypothetical protein [Nocardia mexicana]RDI43481.1 hypothetical protein DFR68_12138 [Nocardia mexicana]
MSNDIAVIELVSHYESYASPEEINMSMNEQGEKSTPACLSTTATSACATPTIVVTFAERYAVN